MIQQSRSKKNDDIELSELLIQIWKNKILVILLCFFLTIIGYLYGSNKEKIYETKVTLIDAPRYVFDEFSTFLKIDHDPNENIKPGKKVLNIASDFNDTIKINILSHDYLYEFAQNYDQMDEFKSYLRKENIDLRNYFQGKITATDINHEKIDKTSSFTLNFKKPLSGEKFLNDYILFIKEKSRVSFSKDLSRIILNKLKIYNHNLTIAEKIDLQNPILTSMVEGNSIVNEPTALFYMGTKALTQEIKYLEYLLNNSRNLDLNYNLILEKATTPSLVSKPPIIFAAISLLIGIFLSLIIIICRFLLSKKS